MGKSKKRSFNKAREKDITSVKRADAVTDIINSIRNNSLDSDIKNLISLFGITSEELTEAGATYEELSAVKHLIF